MNRLKSDLIEAMKDRRKTEVRAIRSLISAIDNAGAVPATDEHQPTVGFQAEVARRQPAPEEISRLVAAELDERRTAAVSYRDLGQTESAQTLEDEAAVISRYL